MIINFLQQREPPILPVLHLIENEGKPVPEDLSSVGGGSSSAAESSNMDVDEDADAAMASSLAEGAEAKVCGTSNHFHFIAPKSRTFMAKIEYLYII